MSNRKASQNLEPDWTLLAFLEALPHLDVNKSSYSVKINCKK